MNKMNVLFLADTSHHTQAVTDHIKAITAGIKINWFILNPLTNKTIDKINFSMFDAIGIHYSIKPYNYYYLSKGLRDKIAQFNGFKFQFLQDEYQQVNLVQDFLSDLKINVLFTLVSNNYLDKAYPDQRLKHLKKIPILTAYVSEDLKNIDTIPIAKRTVDVSYRARRYEYWLGSLAYEKQFIADKFIQMSVDKSLNLDISLQEEDRLYGDAWLSLLKNSKAVLGVESGASIWDFDGSIEHQTRQYLKRNKLATFSEVHKDLLHKYDNNIIYNAISPRVFEAAATKTPMIMFPGEFSGVCEPDKHYIVLEKDFSNFDNVLEKLKDNEYLQRLADRVYDDLIISERCSQKQLTHIVEEVIIENVVTLSEKHNKELILDEISQSCMQYKFLNQVRCIKTEFIFIVNNFLSLLFDPRFTLKERLKTLSKGLKRYIAYLIPRFRNNIGF